MSAEPEEDPLEDVVPLDAEHELGVCRHRRLFPHGGWILCTGCGAVWWSQVAPPAPALRIRRRET